MGRDKLRKANDNSRKADWCTLASLDESPHTEYLQLTWKAECGESRTLRLGRGKGRKALPIATHGQLLKPNQRQLRH